MMLAPTTPPRYTPPVRLWLLYVTLGATLLLALTAAYYLNNTDIREKDRLRFHRLTQHIQDDIASHLETCVALLRAGAGFVTAIPALDHEQFRTFANQLHLDLRYPGMRGIGFSRRLQPEERGAITLARQLQDETGFAIWPTDERAEYHTILYLEPLDLHNSAALGYDMFTEPVRRAAMERARDTGRPAASGKVVLQQDIEAQKQAGFLIYVPVYKSKTIPQSLEERRALLLGFVYGPFRVGDFLHSIITPALRRDLAIRVFAGAELTSEQLIYQSSSAAEAQLPSWLTTTARIDIYGQPWSIQFATLPPFDAYSDRRQVVLLLSVVGGAFSLVLFWGLRVQTAIPMAATRSVLHGSVVTRCRTMSVASGFLSCAVGIVVLIGWQFDIVFLKSIMPHFATMKANTALGFVLTGVALLGRQERPGHRLLDSIGCVCAVSVALLGLLTLVQYTLGWELGIDQWLFQDTAAPLAMSPPLTPGRMSVLTALNFLLFGLALLWLDMKTRREQRPTEYLVLLGLLISLLAITKYLYGTETWGSLAPDFSSVAIHTAVTFLALGSGIVLARPDRGVMAILSSATDGGWMGRRLLPTALGLLLFMGWAEYQGVRVGLYSERLGLAVFTISFALILTCLIILTAGHLCRSHLQRQRSEEKLAQLTRQHQLILESAGEGIVVVDAQAQGIFANAAAMRMTGYTVEEMLGTSLHDLLHHSKADGTPYPREECPTLRMLHDGIPIHGTDGVYWRKDGTSFPVEYTSTPIRERGEVVGAVIMFRDITERQTVERMKDQFISVVSHELRTPLTSIRGSLGLLVSGKLGGLPTQAQHLLDIAAKNTDRLVRLINDILDIERIESGKITLNKQPCVVLELMTQAAEVMRTMAEQAAVTLTVVPLEAPAATLWADPDRVLQTLTNLLSNAIKFSPPETTVRLRAVSRGEQMLFQVQDQGRGIPAEKLDSIFERFQQVDASDAREKGGTGLGLAICRSIVQQHGGRIWVESTLGAGSTFTFTLPLLAHVPHAIPAQSPPGPTVLVCDDDPVTSAVLEGLLTRQGYRVVTAASGREGIVRAVAERPAAMLLDLLMPDMDGWETLAALKQQPETSTIPVIICSVLSPTERPSTASGIVDWVHKPVREASLIQALERALQGPQPRINTVLIVEEDASLAQVLCTIFERHGVTTVQARTCREAFQYSQRALPDLIVLDLMLPDGDGYTVVDWLRSHSQLRQVPLVVYSAQDLDAAEQERLTLSQTHFFIKGRITPAEFEQRVFTILGQLVPQRPGDASDSKSGEQRVFSVLDQGRPCP